MKYDLIAIRDNKANYFWQPQITVNEATGKRWFGNIINSGDIRSDLCYSPGDFDLYKIGDFDSDTGVCTALVPAEFIVNGRNLLEVKE